MRTESGLRRRGAWVAAMQALAFAVALFVAIVAGCGGQSTCGDTQSDPDNCGACGTACMPNQVCQQGMCVLGCSGGTTACGSSCSDLQVDPANCGACGTACKAGQVCSGGQCQAGCPGGLTACSGTCVDTKVDKGNCGGCGKACGAGDICAGSSCKTTCSAGQAACTTDAGALYCANTQQDNANCGGCGMPCKVGDVCANGKCASDCGAGQTYCADDGGGNGPYCANTQTDNANCGSCGNACLAAQSCVGGKCVIQCGGVDGGPEVFCTPDGGTAYCANTQTDQANCGSCGNVCPQGQVCSGGTCACAPGLTQCPGDGGLVCVNTGADDNNCGGCGNVCPPMTPTCSLGTCVACGVNDVIYNGHCYYLDGSQGACDPGYSLASQSVLTNIHSMFNGLNYKHTISGNCCVFNADPNENWGMTTHCNSNGPFDSTEPALGGAGCTNVMQNFPNQLTLCGR